MLRLVRSYLSFETKRVVSASIATAPHTRRLALELLEEREMLSGTPTPYDGASWYCASSERVTQFEPISLTKFAAELAQACAAENVEREPCATERLEFQLVGVSNAVVEEEETEGFTWNGVHFVPFETLRTRQLTFTDGELVDTETELSLHPMSGPIVGGGLASPDSGGAGGSGGSGGTGSSGGSGGSSQNWDVEVTTTYASVISELGDRFDNPLLEHRVGVSGGGTTPPSDCDYLLITFPALSFGYSADVTY